MLIRNKYKGNIYVTIFKDVANFKILIPWEWCKEIGITDEDRNIFIEYDKKSKNLIISKNTESKSFIDLTKEEKILQINKYRKLYENRYDKKKDFINDMAEFFCITYRTAYRYLKTVVPDEILEEVKLIGEFGNPQYGRNRNLMLRESGSSNTVILSIPTALAVLFLKGKNYEELKIKNVTEIYSKNENIPITMEFIDEKIYIRNGA